MFKSGFIALTGRPNVGKSTLMNLLVGEKAAIISEKPQTTRNRIRGILTTADCQAVFIDTPGIHKPRHRLGERMVQIALNTVREVDLILLLADAGAGPGSGDEYIIQALQSVDTPVVLVLNKADLVTGDRKAELISLYNRLYPFVTAVAVSALTGYNRDKLLEVIVGRLPAGPCYYPPDMVTDQPERFIVAELIREKILRLTREEVPHAVAVEVEAMRRREDRDLVDIEAFVFVEKESQKGIIVGKGGAMLKQVGVLARRDIEALLGGPVYLRLRVKVRRDWRNREGTWRGLGLEME
jgi:GTP-binding protein Era